METDCDHIHLLLSCYATEKVSDIIHCLKQETTWEFWHWKKHVFWSEGYFACSVGEVSQATIERYIENQG